MEKSGFSHPNASSVCNAAVLTSFSELCETLIWKALAVKLVLGQDAPFYFLSPEGPIGCLVSEQENVHSSKFSSVQAVLTFPSSKHERFRHPALTELLFLPTYFINLCFLHFRFICRIALQGMLHDLTKEVMWCSGNSVIYLSAIPICLVIMCICLSALLVRKWSQIKVCHLFKYLSVGSAFWSHSVPFQFKENPVAFNHL